MEERVTYEGKFLFSFFLKGVHVYDFYVLRKSRVFRFVNIPIKDPRETNPGFLGLPQSSEVISTPELACTSGLL